VQLRDRRLELRVGAGLEQPKPADVMVEVEARRIEPYGIREIHRHEAEAPREDRREVKALLDMAADRFVGRALAARRARRFQAHQAADMHRCVGVSSCRKRASRALRCLIFNRSGTMNVVSGCFRDEDKRFPWTP
jgi:hypothetical protein